VLKLISKKLLQGGKEMASKLYEALLAVYRDIDLQNVEGGSDELNLMVQEALTEAESLGLCLPEKGEIAVNLTGWEYILSYGYSLNLYSKWAG